MPILPPPLFPCSSTCVQSFCKAYSTQDPPACPTHCGGAPEKVHARFAGNGNGPPAQLVGCDHAGAEVSSQGFIGEGVRVEGLCRH